MADSTADLQFFNYHEYIQDSNDPALVVNHFPNYYVGKDSVLFQTTRIVRIARVYDKTMGSDVVPQFSNIVPGTEDAALKKVGVDRFESVGEYDGNRFGITSITPLVPSLLPEKEFIDIVDHVNQLLFDAYNPWNMSNLLDNLLDFLTSGIYSDWVKTFSKRKLLELEDYIIQINLKLDNNVKIISPRISGYLSLDFQIPKP